MKACYFALKFCKKLLHLQKVGGGAILLLFLGCFLSIGNVKRAESADSQPNLDCSSALQSFTDPIIQIQINRMIPQVEKILNQVPITAINKNSVKAIQMSINQWKIKQETFETETLLQFARFFDILPSVMLDSENLASKINLENLKLRSYLPPEDISALMKIVGSHLKAQIEEFEYEFTLDIGEDIGLTDLAEMMEVESDKLDLIKGFLFVPDLLQLDRILNIGSSLVIFLEDLESSDDFKTHFRAVDDFMVHTTSAQEPDFSNEPQILSDMGHRLIEAMGARQIEATRLYPLLGYTKSDLESGRKNFKFSLVVKVSYITGYSVKDIISGNISQDASSSLRLTGTAEYSRDTYIDRAKKIVSYLIKLEIRQREISIQELAEKSQVPIDTIQSFLTGNQGIRYFTLFKIVEHGLGIPLADFLGYENNAISSLEDLIEEFDTIDFDVDMMSI